MAMSSFLGSSSIASLKSSAALPPSPAKSPSSRSPHLIVKASGSKKRKDAVSIAAAAILVGGMLSGSLEARAGLVENLLEKTSANKELNDKKRLATSGANLSRAYTVQFNTCKFPENFTGCQDLAKKKEVKFITEDLKLECEGKDKYKCGSNVFWKWGK